MLVADVIEAQDIFDPELTPVRTVRANGSPQLALLIKRKPEEFDEEREREMLQNEDLQIIVNLGGDGYEEGGKEALYCACDMSHVYIAINGGSRT